MSEAARLGVMGLLLAVVTVTSNAASAAPPCWVAPGRCPEFPTEQFILGTGSAQLQGRDPGEAEEAARMRAFAAIAQQMRVDVTATTWVSAFESATAGGETLGEDVTTTAAVLLEGAQIRGRWEDPDGKIVHALAIVDRDAFAQSVGGAGRQRNRMLKVALRRADAAGSSSPLAAMRHLHEAAQHAAEAERRADLVVLVGRAPGYEIAASAAAVAARLAALRRELGVSVSLAETGGGSDLFLGPAVEEALGRERVPVARHGRSAVVRVEGTAKARYSSSLTKRLHIAKARAVVRIIRTADDQVVATVERESKAGGATKKKARAAALKKLADDLGSEVGGLAAKALRAELNAMAGTP